jgi:hypothetical protein
VTVKIKTAVYEKSRQQVFICSYVINLRSKKRNVTVEGKLVIEMFMYVLSIKYFKAGLVIIDRKILLYITM